MFGDIIKTSILTIFVLIIFHFIIEHTKNIWYIPKNIDYEPSYKKIVKLLDNFPNKEDLSKSIKHTNNTEESTESMESTESTESIEAKLNEYISNMT